MSTYNDASLIYYPSGVKADKAYSLKPTDGSGDLTFTRASTATRVNESGLIESVATGVPRIDFTGGGCGSLLLEAQRTNVMFPSNVSTSWASIGGTTVTANVTTSPDGTLNATGMYESNTTNVFVKYKDATIPTGAVSIYAIVKTNGRNIQLGDLGGGGGENAKFDLVNGTIIAQNTSNNAYIQSYGDGWYKVGFSMTKSVTLLRFGIYTLDYETSNTTHAGDSTKGIFIYHVQGEQGSYSTSVIPTTTTAVTRVADVASKTGISSLIGQTEGTLYAEVYFPALTFGQSAYVSLTSGSFLNAVLIGKEPGSPDKYGFYIIASGTTIFVNTSNNLQNNFVKMAIAYKSGDWAAYLNGTLVASGTSTFTFNSPLSVLGLGPNNSGISITSEASNVRAVMTFPTRKSNTDLAALTTL